LDEDCRGTQLQRLRRLMAMATTSELHRAADFLEFAAGVRQGKRRQRSGWRGRRSSVPLQKRVS
jgi:hypothetical protein